MQKNLQKIKSELVIKIYDMKEGMNNEKNALYAFMSLHDDRHIANSFGCNC